MTELLQSVFERLSRLPAERQDALAREILSDLDDEERWQESFARSPALLDRLADEALMEMAAGTVRPGDPGGDTA